MNSLIIHRTQLNEYGNKEDSMLRINWLIKKDTTAHDKGLR